MMTKNLKNKVLLSVFAGAMVFSCAASAAEIVLDNVDTTQDKWYESYGLKQSNGQIKGFGPINKKDTLVLKNLKTTESFTNVTNVDNSILDSSVVIGGFAEDGSGNAEMVSNNTVTVTNSTISQIMGAFSNEYDVNRNIVDVSNIKKGETVIYGGYVGPNGENSANGNKIYLTDSDVASAFGAYVGNEVGNANGNEVHLDKSKIERGFIAYSLKGTTNENGLVIENKSTVVGQIVVGMGDREACDNFVTIKGQNTLSEAYLYGWSAVQNNALIHSGNSLNIDDFTGEIAAVACFDIINFENLDLNKEKTLTIKEYTQELENTEIQISSFTGGQNFEVGKTVDLLKVENKDSWDESFTNLNKQTTTNAGVAQVITSDIAKR